MRYIVYLLVTYRDQTVDYIMAGNVQKLQWDFLLVVEPCKVEWNGLIYDSVCAFAVLRLSDCMLKGKHALIELVE